MGNRSERPGRRLKLHVGHDLDAVTVAPAKKDGAKPALVVHGLFASSKLVGPLERGISQRTTYDVFTLHSEGVQGLMDFDWWIGHGRRVSGAIAKIADTYQESVTLVGHSHGGLVATEIAQRRHEDISKVVILMGPVGLVEEIPTDVSFANIWSEADRLINPCNPLINPQLLRRWFGPDLIRARHMLNPDNPLFGEPVVFRKGEGIRHLDPLNPWKPNKKLHDTIAQQAGHLKGQSA